MVLSLEFFPGVEVSLDAASLMLLGEAGLVFGCKAPRPCGEDKEDDFECREDGFIVKMIQVCGATSQFNGLP